MAEQYDLLRTRSSRRSVLKGAVLLSAGPLLLRSAKADSAAPMGPRWIAFGNDPQTSMTVSSSISGSFRSATVEYGQDSNLGSTVPLDVKGTAGVSTRYGSARLTGLSPGASHSYRIRVDGRDGATSVFRTAPTQARTFTFSAFGDEGTTGISRQIVEQVARHHPQLQLVAGDLCYAYTAGTGLSTGKLKLSLWDKWLRLIEPVAADTPWMTTVGNHEMEPGFGPQGYDGYLARFTLPTSGATACPSTYHYRYGSVAFVHADSNDVSYEIPHNLNYSNGAQDRWLETVLAGYRRPGSGIEFIVVVMHHCAYSTATAHGSEGGVRAHWIPLFDRYSVDLVISGHNHSYERSHPVRAGRITQHVPRNGVADSATGTSYVTVGGGGVGVNPGGFYRGSTHVSTLERSRSGKDEAILPAEWSSVTDKSYCYAICKVNPGLGARSATLTLRMYNQQGVLIDSVTLERRMPSPSRPDETGLYVGVGAGAALLATAGAGLALVHRRRPAA